MVALYIKQRMAGSASAIKLSDTIRSFGGERMDGGYDYLKLERMAYYVHKESYRRTIKQHIKSLLADYIAMNSATVKAH